MESFCGSVSSRGRIGSNFGSSTEMMVVFSLEARARTEGAAALDAEDSSTARCAGFEESSVSDASITTASADFSTTDAFRWNQVGNQIRLAEAAAVDTRKTESTAH